MTTHPEDTPMNRFTAFWWAIGAIFSFGILLMFIAVGTLATGGGTGQYDETRARERGAKLKAVVVAQGDLLAGAGEAAEGGEGKIRIPVEMAAVVMLKELKPSAPKKTAVPVPGSPAALELMQKQQAEAEAKSAAEAKAGGGADKPAPPKEGDGNTAPPAN